METRIGLVKVDREEMRERSGVKIEKLLEEREGDSGELEANNKLNIYDFFGIQNKWPT